MEEESKEVEKQEEAQDSAQSISQEELNLKIEELKLEQNLPFAIIAGAGSAIVMAILWAAITVATGYQIGYMAIAVGFVVGYAVRYAGKGIDQIFGITGALTALFGCILGNFLAIIGFLANEYELGYFEILTNLDFSILLELMKETFDMVDLLFYGIALYEGYKFSFRKITEG